MNTLFKTITLALLILLSACGEEKIYGPIQNDGTAPGQVSNLSYEPQLGGAIISYTIPQDADLAYIKAVYEITTGQVEVKASHYTNNLTIMGFGDTTEQEVKLYAVDRGENASEAATLMVKPDIPPLYWVYNDIDFINDFGGFNVEWENPTEAALSFYLLNYNDSAQGWEPMDAYTVYSDLAEYTLKVRNRLDTMTYGMYVKDYYGNSSDTLVQVVEPLFEESIDKSTWKNHPLSTDVAITNMEKMWDGPDGSGACKGARDGFDSPQYFTIDLGKTVQLSRIHIDGWGNSAAAHYNWSNPSHYRVYARMDAPTDDNLEGWEEIVDHVVETPSGAYPPTQEDEELAEQAYTAEIPLEMMKNVRYLRFAIVDTWAYGPYDTRTCPLFQIKEINLWGLDNIE